MLTNVCVKFWYYMYSNLAGNLGRLNVWLYDIKTNQSQIIWKLEFSQAREWREGRISYNINDRHKIIFEGIKGPGRGDIAIDDITFSSATRCNLSPPEAAPDTVVTDVSTTTRLITTLSTYNWNSVSEYDCNFENDYCLWTNDSTANFAWVRALASAISGPLNAPKEDHTYQNSSGYYIRIDVRLFVSKKKTRFFFSKLNIFILF